MQFYEVFALKSKNKTGQYYKFYVRRKLKKYVVDYLGWCRLKPRGFKQQNKNLNTLFFCINFKKFSVWFLKGVVFKKRAFNLIFGLGFINIYYIKNLTFNLKNINKLYYEK